MLEEGTEERREEKKKEKSKRRKWVSVTKQKGKWNGQCTTKQNTENDSHPTQHTRYSMIITIRHMIKIIETNKTAKRSSNQTKDKK